MALREKFKDLLPHPPRIVDPANPATNLYNAIKDNKWHPFATKVMDKLDIGPGIMTVV